MANVLALPEDTASTCIWIYKPSATGEGRGIELIYNLSAFKATLVSGLLQNNRTFVLQRYIERPLLLLGRKFDFRCFAMVVSSEPFVLIFRHGYVRRSLQKYDLNDLEHFAHLVNHSVQKKHPQYKAEQDDVHWDMLKFEQNFRKEYPHANLT
jgi:tubulin monoglycylase TTLL3/8